MTDLSYNAVPARRAPKAALLTLAAVAVSLPAGPALAQAIYEESGTAEAPDVGDQPADAPMEDQQGLEDQQSQTEKVEAEGPASSVQLYGPPSPKVEHGQLSEIGWEPAPEQFPPALEEAINIVTKNYPSALSARAAVRAAASDLKAAKWTKFPSITANAILRESNNRAGTGRLDPQLQVEAPIWTGGRIGASIRRAEASEDASSAQYVETVQQLAITTANTYFEIVRLTQAEQLLAESVELHNRLVGTMERRVSQEVSPVADLELARSRAAQIQQQYTVTQAQRRTALRILAELVADPAYDLGPIPYYNPELDLPNRDVLEDQAVAYDPTLRRLRSQADIARAEMDTTRASILPQLNAQYSYDDLFGSRVGVVVRAQTTGGLSQFSQVNAARLRIQSALEDVRVTEQQLRRDVASEIIQYEAAKSRAAISRDASDTAARVSESYMRQFIAGRRSWLDVMNALREAVTAQLSKADAEVTVMVSAARLLLRSGRWHPMFAQPAPSESDRLDIPEPRRVGPRKP